MPREKCTQNRVPKATTNPEKVAPGEPQMTPKRRGPPLALEFGPLRNLHRHGPNVQFADWNKNVIFRNHIFIQMAEKFISTTPVQCLYTCEKDHQRGSTPKCDEIRTPWPPKRRPEVCKTCLAHYGKTHTQVHYKRESSGSGKT